METYTSVVDALNDLPPRFHFDLEPEPGSATLADLMATPELLAEWIAIDAARVGAPEGQVAVAEQAEVPEKLKAALPRPPPSLLAVLIGLGALQAFVAIPWIVGSDPFGLLGTAAPPTHTTRDGAVGIVIAAAAILTGIWPRWARPAFYLSGTVVVAQAIAGVVDKSIVETGLPEVIHLLGVGLTILIGVCIIYQIVDPFGPSRPPPLRGVDSGA